MDRELEGKRALNPGAPVSTFSGSFGAARQIATWQRVTAIQARASLQRGGGTLQYFFEKRQIPRKRERGTHCAGALPASSGRRIRTGSRVLSSPSPTANPVGRHGTRSSGRVERSFSRTRASASRPS